MEQKFFKFYNNEKTRLAFTIASAVIIAALSPSETLSANLCILYFIFLSQRADK